MSEDAGKRGMNWRQLIVGGVAVDCWHSLFYAVLMSFSVLILLAIIHTCAYGG